jgi:hypothetical protein
MANNLIPLKQIDGFINAYILLSGINVTGSSSNVTSALSTACNTAGKGGTSVPFVQFSSYDNGQGISTDGTRLLIYDSADKSEFKDSSGNFVYGKLTFASNVFTLSFYSLVAGAETAYSFSSATSIGFNIVYVFSLATFPPDALTKVGVVELDSSTLRETKSIREVITVATTNTITQKLSYTPLYGVEFRVNSVPYYTVDTAPLFSVGGTGNKDITITASNGFDVTTTDKVTAHYEYYA